MNRFIAFLILGKGQSFICSEDKTEYVMLDGRLKRYFSKVFSFIQFALWKIKINIHNPISGECTPDFSCCVKATEDQLTASEALFGFAGWLTTRDKTVIASAKHDAAIWADLVGMFIIENNLERPRDGWEQNLVHPVEVKEDE